VSGEAVMATDLSLNVKDALRTRRIVIGIDGSECNCTLSGGSAARCGLGTTPGGPTAKHMRRSISSGDSPTSGAAP